RGAAAPGPAYRRGVRSSPGQSASGVGAASGARAARGSDDGGSARCRISSEGSEEAADVVHEEIGHLHRREVSTTIELRPMHDVRVGALRERADRLEVLLE